MDIETSDNFNAELIAEEAEHLEKTLALMREQIELLENDGFAYRTVDIYDDNDVEEYRTDKFRHDARKLDADILKRSLSAPYFARMKLQPIGEAERSDERSITKARDVYRDGPAAGETADIYVGANVIFYKDRIIVFSHNSPLGNKVYERFEEGRIEYGGYIYKVMFRRKFDIREGKLQAVFQDFSDSEGAVVYDKFLAHMLKVKRGDKRLTDIIPTIQANQNAIIIRPADENCIVSGCAGCGKTMIMLQRLEYLSFNKKAELENTLIIAPGKRYIEHIQPVVDDLMINASGRVTMQELYRELILSLRGIKGAVRRELNTKEPIGDDGLADDAVAKCYGDGVKRKLIQSLSETRKAYRKRLSEYREKCDLYERELARVRGTYMQPEVEKPKLPVISIDLRKMPFIPDIGTENTKCRLYLLLTAYCYVLGKTAFCKTLFIDEGQDYFLNEYRLLSEVTRATVNIYGDVNQQLVGSRGIGDFSRLSELWDIKNYSLNENYRNAREITEYINGLFGMNVTSLGLEGGSVTRCRADNIPRLISESGSDRLAVIYSPNDEKTASYLRRAVPSARLYTVLQCKGMEYERVIACGKMSDTEKYVAYTRALDKLYITD